MQTRQGQCNGCKIFWSWTLNIALKDMHCENEKCRRPLSRATKKGREDYTPMQSGACTSGVAR